jgi:hypothetical protein
MKIKYVIFAEEFGGLAHLARALAWQARGGRFESDILHCNTTLLGCVFSLKLIEPFKT